MSKEVDTEANGLARGISLASEEGVRAIEDQLAQTRRRREELEHSVNGAERELAALEEGKADPDAGREGLRNFGRVFEHLQPYERRELVRLVLRRAILSDRELVLEIFGPATGSFAGRKESEPGARFAEPTIWLPDEDSNLEPSG